jgi:hypothetical protein
LTCFACSEPQDWTPRTPLRGTKAMMSMMPKRSFRRPCLAPLICRYRSTISHRKPCCRSSRRVR